MHTLRLPYGRSNSNQGRARSLCEISRPNAYGRVEHNPERMLYQMGFGASATAAALREAGGDVQGALERLLAPPPSVPSAASTHPLSLDAEAGPTHAMRPTCDRSVDEPGSSTFAARESSRTYCNGHGCCRVEHSSERMLCEMGFDAIPVAAALRATGGDFDGAVELLLAQTSRTPHTSAPSVPDNEGNDGDDDEA